MTSFVEVTVDELERPIERANSVSAQIIRDFMNTNMYAAKPEMNGTPEGGITKQATVLSQYARNHGLPVKALTRGGTLIVKRLDIDKDGNAVPNWQESPEARARQTSPRGQGKRGKGGTKSASGSASASASA